MIVKDYIKEFYTVLKDERILIMVGSDVDALCALKILQHLFQVDGYTYTVAPVQDVPDMKRKFDEYHNVKRIILINCGGTDDVLSIFEHPPEVIFFIIDSHRPFHLLNIYDMTHQVRILAPLKEKITHPRFDEIFWDVMDIENKDGESDDDSITEEETIENPIEGEESVFSLGRKRKFEKRTKMAEVAKRRKDLQTNRSKAIFEYTKYNSFGDPASMVVLELAWFKSVVESELVWWAIVGTTQYLALHQISRINYILLAVQLKAYVAKISHEGSGKTNKLRIISEDDFYLILYRHWNMYDSLKYTPLWRSTLSMWCRDGERKLRQFLAKNSLPLGDLQESFSTMKSKSLTKAKVAFNNLPHKHSRMDDVTFGTFSYTINTFHKFFALDKFFVVHSLLEETGISSFLSRFGNAFDSLQFGERNVMLRGTHIATLWLKKCTSVIQYALQSKEIIITNDFMYTIMSHHDVDSKYFMNPGNLALLAYAMLEAYCVSGNRDKQTENLPYILCAPRDELNHHIIGIPPYGYQPQENIFGKAFQQISQLVPGCSSTGLFDKGMCVVKSAEVQHVFQALIDFLQ